MIIDLIFAAAAVVTVAAGIIAEKHIENEDWGKKKRFHQEVRIAYNRLLIRHRTPYAEIGFRYGRY